MSLPLILLCAAATLAEPIAVYDQALDAREHRDAQRFTQLTSQLLEYAPRSPPLRFLHAEALAMSGRTEPALAQLQWLATNGYHYAFWERESFAGLPAAAAAALRAATTKNGRPGGTVARVVRLDRDDLDPEGIDALGQDWIVGSMTNGNLYRIDRSGATTVLWRETAVGRRLFGVRHDPQRNLVWACSNGRDDRHAQSELLRVALEPPAVARWPVPDPAALCNDIAMLPDGAVALSDSQRGAVWRLDSTGQWRQLAAPGTFGYPNGIAYQAESRQLVVADLRGLWTIDVAQGRVATIAEQSTFSGGIDGLYAANGGLVAIQNGVRPERVLRIALSPGATKVTSMTVVATNLPHLAGMTTAAAARDKITVLAGSQLVELVSSDSASD